MATYANLRARLEAQLEAIEDALTLDMAGAAAGGEEDRAFEQIVREMRELLTANVGDRTAIRSAVASLAPAALLTSAARTADTTTSDQTNNIGKGVVLVLDITAGTGTIEKLTVNGKNAAGTTFKVADITPASAVGGAAGRHIFVMVPNPNSFATPLKFAAGAKGSLPKNWHVVVDHTDATSVTYTLDAFVLV